jgi:hypothetical protein
METDVITAVMRFAPASSKPENNRPIGRLRNTYDARMSANCPCLAPLATSCQPFNERFEFRTHQVFHQVKAKVTPEQAMKAQKGVEV